MTWARRFRLRESIRHSLWLLPLAGAIIGVLVALLTVRVGNAVHMPEPLTFTPATASSVLSAMLGAMIGLIGFVVTVTVLLVQTSTSQFSARYMRLVYRDPLLKASLAVLVGTFAYAFALLRRVTDTDAPDLGLAILPGFVLLGVFLFLIFFSRLLQRLRPAAVAAAVSELGIAAFLGLQQPAPSVAPASDASAGSPWAVRSTRRGAIQAISITGLVAWATAHECMLVFHRGIGDFVHRGETLLEVHGSHQSDEAVAALEGLVALGKERTIDQDPAFAIRVMADVANRALSAAVNDPTTAVQVLDYIEDMLLTIGAHEFTDRGTFCDANGTPRLVLPARGWNDYLALSMTEIRHYGGGSIQVVRRLRSLLESLDAEVLPQHRAAVEEELTRLNEITQRRFGDVVDHDRAVVADRQGIGGPSDSRAGMT